LLRDGQGRSRRRAERGQVGLRLRDALGDGPFQPNLGILIVLITGSTATEIATQHHLGMSVPEFGSSSEPLLGEWPVRRHAVAAGVERAERKHRAGMTVGSCFLEQV
jgi:hypothetical protein